MKKKHWFKNKEMIYCAKTKGEFSILLWNLGKLPEGYCPCCNKQIEKGEL